MGRRKDAVEYLFKCPSVHLQCSHAYRQIILLEFENPVGIDRRIQLELANRCTRDKMTRMSVGFIQLTTKSLIQALHMAAA
jgi:hypothetical protein